MNFYTFIAYLIFFNRSVSSEFLISISKGTDLKLIKYFNLHSDIIIHPEIRDVFYKKLESINSLHFLNKKKFFLFVGTIEPRKNLELVLKAYTRILSSYPDILFVIAGNFGWKSKSIIHEINKNKKIIFIKNPSDKKIKFLYSNCHAFIFTSLYEGFGIPPREALASMAKNIIISDLIELKEGIIELPNVLTVNNNMISIYNAMKKTIINQSINRSSFKYEPIRREDFYKFKKYIKTI
jgi:glycosyltransferase involved in cell wall biosynthesis